MAHCFSLTPKGQKIPALFTDVDIAMRRHFGAQQDEKNWYQNWYNSVGMCMAAGMDWNWLRKHLPEHAVIINWLEDNYTVGAWRE